MTLSAQFCCADITQLPISYATLPINRREQRSVAYYFNRDSLQQLPKAIAVRERLRSEGIPPASWSKPDGISYPRGKRRR
jgi:hypothetical protein